MVWHLRRLLILRYMPMEYHFPTDCLLHPCMPVRRIHLQVLRYHHHHLVLDRPSMAVRLGVHNRHNRHNRLRPFIMYPRLLLGLLLVLLADGVTRQLQLLLQHQGLISQNTWFHRATLALRPLQGSASTLMTCLRLEVQLQKRLYLLVVLHPKCRRPNDDSIRTPYLHRQVVPLKGCLHHLQ